MAVGLAPVKKPKVAPPPAATGGKNVGVVAPKPLPVKTIAPIAAPQPADAAATMAPLATGAAREDETGMRPATVPAPSNNEPATPTTGPTGGPTTTPPSNETPTTTPAVNPATGLPYDTVEGLVDQITSKNSLLMKNAETAGLKQANRRGMLNSSMAVGEAQRAVIDAALPIASQDSSQSFGRYLQDDQQGFIGGQAELDRAHDLTIQQNQLTAAEEAQIRDIKFRQGEAAAERAMHKLMQSKELAWRKVESRLDRSLQQKIASWNISTSERVTVANTMIAYEEMYNRMVQSINNNTSLSAKARTQQLASAKALREKQMNLLERLYSVDVNGATGW